MKKFVTTALLGITSAACALAFTACGGGNDTPTNTVNETEWKTAITAITDGNHSVDCKWTTEFDEDATIYTTQYDSSNNALKFSYPEDEAIISVYLWKNADKYYDSSSKNNVTEIDKEEYDEAITGNLNAYAGGFILTALSEQYGKFTYDEDKKEYSANIKLEIENYYEDTETTNYVLKFENGKIVSLVVTGSYDEHPTTDTYEYGYSVSVTVPQELKDKM